MLRGLLRRLRGALGTAVVWAVGWAGASVVVTSVLQLLGIGTTGLPFWQFAIVVAQNFAGFGFLCGGAFSLFLGVAGRKKSLEELNAGLFGAGGAVVAGIFLPVFTMVVNGLGGSPTPMAAVASMSGIAATLGGLTAFGTIKLAQGSSHRLSEGYMGELESEQDGITALLEE